MFYEYKGQLPEDGKVTVKWGTVSLADGAFWESEVKEVELPETIVYIGADAFYRCENLTELRLPEGLTGIMALGITGGGIKTIYLPSTIEWLGWSWYPSEVENVYFNGTKERWKEIVAASSPECEPACGVTFLK